MTNPARQISGILLTAAIVFASMAIFSWSVTWLWSWNLLSAIAFWYILVPIIANLAAQILKTNNPFKTTILGLLLFYAVMFFMIYKQLDTDFGILMKYSPVSSLFFLFVFHYDRLFPSKLVSGKR